MILDDNPLASYKARVERRAKYLATLSPAQHQSRDAYIAYVRWWRKEYKALVNQITNNKNFIRKQGHNNLASLKLAMKRLERTKLQARTMLLARSASKADHKSKTLLEGQLEPASSHPPSQAV